MRSIQSRQLWVVLASGALGACGPQEVDELLYDDETIDAAALRGGTIAGGKGVVHLQIPDPDSLTPVASACTGTIIHEHALVTAAHCFDELDSTATATVDLVVSYTADGTTWQCTSARSAEVCGFLPVSMTVARLSGDWQDFAVVISPTRWANVPTSAYRRLTTVPQPIGNSVRVWGRGRNGFGGTTDGAMRVVSLRIEEVVDGSHYLLANTSTRGTCNGDSGGPYFASASDDFVAAVHNSAPKAAGTSCGAANGKARGSFINASKIRLINSLLPTGTPTCRQIGTSPGYYTCK